MKTPLIYWSLVLAALAPVGAAARQTAPAPSPAPAVAAPAPTPPTDEQAEAEIAAYNDSLVSMNAAMTEALNAVIAERASVDEAVARLSAIYDRYEPAHLAFADRLEAHLRHKAATARNRRERERYLARAEAEPAQVRATRANLEDVTRRSYAQYLARR